jgi:hypothetical protein
LTMTMRNMTRIVLTTSEYAEFLKGDFSKTKLFSSAIR